MSKLILIALSVFWAMRFLHRRDWLPFCPWCAARRDFIAWGFKLYRRERRKGSSAAARLHVYWQHYLTKMINDKLREALKNRRTAQRLLKEPIALRFPELEYGPNDYQHREHFL